MGGILRTIGAAIILMLLWLLMSGVYTNLVIGLGIASVILAVFVARRMDAVDGMRVEISISPLQFIGYFIWLFVEIAKANLAVTRLILSRGPRTRQHLFAVPYSQRTDLAQAIFANSITLTPGTITVEVEPGHFLVHAVDYSDDDPDALADMNRRVAATEGGA